MKQTRNTKRIGLFLDPLDVLFFRDGRPFTQASHARGDLPLPQTLTGALTTHLLKKGGLNDFGAWKDIYRATKGDMSACLRELNMDTAIADIRFRGPLVGQYTKKF